MRGKERIVRRPVLKGNLVMYQDGANPDGTPRLHFGDVFQIRVQGVFIRANGKVVFEPHDNVVVVLK